ncbi:MAG: tRNA (adenosine(37)-N6)-threonylcarbamoyltransferase complex dimerization subunit type 1 TsaB [Balneolaceae bacterium]
MILAIETSTPVCSVALQATRRTVWEKRIEGRGVHSERLFTFTDELLRRAGSNVEGLEAVLFSRGPGSYTGLRIGSSAVKGLLFRQSVPLYTFPTLYSFAAGLDSGIESREIWGVIDARRTHLYCQKFRWDGIKLTPESDALIKEISEIEADINDGAVIVGTGLERLTFENKRSITKIGTEGISAKNLVRAFNSDHLRQQFRKEAPESFTPEYIEMGQVNNSKIRD